MAVKNEDYNVVLRKMGYVDSGLSRMRLDGVAEDGSIYMIDSYRPGAKKKHKLVEGLVEVHTWGKEFKVVTAFGTYTTLAEAIKNLQMQSPRPKNNG